jgi:uncharacterized membrane protein YphA (DoxX/SURF4 family)
VTALALAARAVLGILFAAAGVLKLRDPASFAREIANYQLLPAAAPYLAIVLPAIEIVAGVALVLSPRLWRQAAAASIAALLALFTAAVGVAAARGVDIACGCFGAGSGRVGGWTIARNLGLIALAGAVLWLEARRFRASPAAASTAGPGDPPAA